MRKILLILIVGIIMMSCSQVEFQGDVIIEQEIRSEGGEISERDMIFVPLVSQPVQIFIMDGNKYFNYQPSNGDTLADISWAMWRGRYRYTEILKIDNSIVDVNSIYTHQIYMIPIIE